MTNPSALEAERAELQRKLAAREGKLGYAANCAAIRAGLAEIEAALQATD